MADSAPALPLMADRFNTLRYEPGRVRILDRRLYPFERVFREYRTWEEVARAIVEMVIQGGPPLAYAAGYALALAAEAVADRPAAEQAAHLEAVADQLRRTRPTADDLHRLLAEALEAARRALDEGGSAAEAVARYVDGQVERGNRVARDCGRRAAELLPDGARILTHCFPGAALAYALYFGRREGKEWRLFASETRPYLQGARLTAAAALEAGVPVAVITDGMGAYLMARGEITHLVTAADRITLDGHVINKVGTFQHALAAHYHRIPFFVLGYDGPDPAAPSPEAVPIEERDPTEVLVWHGRRLAPEGATARYPAFDVTPPHLVSAIVTDRGVFPPHLIVRYFQEAEE